MLTSWFVYSFSHFFEEKGQKGQKGQKYRKSFIKAINGFHIKRKFFRLKNALFSLSTENTLFLMGQKINLGAKMKRRQGWN